MEHSFDLTIPAVTVHSDLISEDFLHAFATEVGVEVDSLTCESTGERAAAEMEWRFSTDKPGIPELAQKLLPDQVRLSWAQEWGPVTDDGAEGTLEVHLLGSPKATSLGTSRLLVVGGGSTLETSTSTKASLPFPLAGKVQSMIDKDLVGWILSVQARVLARRHAD
ncbi:MAG TPA: DUF2505 domain-containing protein [Motilibacterales bacterium]|nr:DUF2505 domain-containing protein [Motilibacterales bacterium]